MVEDDPECARVMELLLSQEGYECILCSETDRAKLLIESQKFHCIILDIKLGLCNGLRFLQTIREKDVRIPVIVFTNMDHLLERAEKLGANVALNKTADAEKLIVTVRHLVSSGCSNEPWEQRVLDENKIIEIDFKRLLSERERHSASQSEEGVAAS